MSSLRCNLRSNLSWKKRKLALTSESGRSRPPISSDLAIGEGEASTTSFFVCCRLNHYEVGTLSSPSRETVFWHMAVRNSVGNATDFLEICNSELNANLAGKHGSKKPHGVIRIASSRVTGPLGSSFWCRVAKHQRLLLPARPPSCFFHSSFACFVPAAAQIGKRFSIEKHFGEWCAWLLAGWLAGSVPLLFCSPFSHRPKLIARRASHVGVPTRAAPHLLPPAPSRPSEQRGVCGEICKLSMRLAPQTVS